MDHLVRAYKLANQGQFAEAIKMVNQGLTDESNDNATRIDRLHMLFEADDPTQAREVFDELYARVANDRIDDRFDADVNNSGTNPRHLQKL
jgi:thioredoxin-like negative regulator of GroEL